MGLLRRRRLGLAEPQGSVGWRGRRGGRRARAESPEEPPHLGQHVVEGHGPGHGEDEAVGGVGLPEPVDEARLRDPRDGRLVPARRQTITARAEEGAAEDAARDLRGLILQAADLRQQHGAFALDLVIGEPRRGGDLVEELEEPRPVSREPPGPELPVLLVGPALEAAARVLRGPGDVERAPRPRPLQDHAAEERGEPVQLRRLLRRAAPRQEGGRHHRRPAVLAHQHRHAVREDQTRHGPKAGDARPAPRRTEARLARDGRGARAALVHAHSPPPAASGPMTAPVKRSARRWRRAAWRMSSRVTRRTAST